LGESRREREEGEESEEEKVVEHETPEVGNKEIETNKICDVSENHQEKDKVVEHTFKQIPKTESLKSLNTKVLNLPQSMYEQLMIEPVEEDHDDDGNSVCQIQLDDEPVFELNKISTISVVPKVTFNLRESNISLRVRDEEDLIAPPETKPNRKPSDISIKMPQIVLKTPKESTKSLPSIKVKLSNNNNVNNAYVPETIHSAVAVITCKDLETAKPKTSFPTYSMEQKLERESKFFSSGTFIGSAALMTGTCLAISMPNLVFIFPVLFVAMAVFMILVYKASKKSNN